MRNTTYALPSETAYHDGPAVLHFERPGTRSTRPDWRATPYSPIDSCKVMPLDWCYLSTEGGGAAGSQGYLRLEAYNAFEFYAEAAPVWWVPGRLFDLRDTWTTFYLKQIEPITVEPGWQPQIFIAATMPPGDKPARLSGWYMKDTLDMGSGDWTYNEVLLTNDPSKWENYSNNPPEDTLDLALATCGFLGWGYRNGNIGRGAQAWGVVGWDEFWFNLKESDLRRLKSGLPVEHVLEV